MRTSDRQWEPLSDTSSFSAPDVPPVYSRYNVTGEPRHDSRLSPLRQGAGMATEGPRVTDHTFQHIQNMPRNLSPRYGGHGQPSLSDGTLVRTRYDSTEPPLALNFDYSREGAPTLSPQRPIYGPLGGPSSVTHPTAMPHYAAGPYGYSASSPIYRTAALPSSAGPPYPAAAPGPAYPTASPAAYRTLNSSYEGLSPITVTGSAGGAGVYIEEQPRALTVAYERPTSAPIQNGSYRGPVSPSRIVPSPSRGRPALASTLPSTLPSRQDRKRLPLVPRVAGLAKRPAPREPVVGRPGGSPPRPTESGGLRLRKPFEQPEPEYEKYVPRPEDDPRYTPPPAHSRPVVPAPDTYIAPSPVHRREDSPRPAVPLPPPYAPYAPSPLPVPVPYPGRTSPNFNYGYGGRFGRYDRMDDIDIDDVSDSFGSEDQMRPHKHSKLTPDRWNSKKKATPMQTYLLIGAGVVALFVVLLLYYFLFRRSNKVNCGSYDSSACRAQGCIHDPDSKKCYLPTPKEIVREAGLKAPYRLLFVGNSDAQARLCINAIAGAYGSSKRLDPSSYNYVPLDNLHLYGTQPLELTNDVEAFYKVRKFVGGLELQQNLTRHPFSWVNDKANAASRVVLALDLSRAVGGWFWYSAKQAGIANFTAQLEKVDTALPVPPLVLLNTQGYSDSTAVKIRDALKRAYRLEYANVATLNCKKVTTLDLSKLLYGMFLDNKYAALRIASLGV